MAKQKQELKCDGYRHGNFPFDDLDRRGHEITRLCWDLTGHVYRRPMAAREIPWGLNGENRWVATALVRSEKADALAAAAVELGLPAEIGEEEDFSYSRRGSTYKVRPVRITLPPLWTSCGCQGCDPIGGKNWKDGPCNCIPHCWCASDGHESKHGA